MITDHLLNALVGQWMIIEAPAENTDQLIVNLDRLELERNRLGGIANYANFGPRPGGSTYAVVVTERDGRLVAIGEPLALYDAEFRRRVPVERPPVFEALVLLGSNQTTATVKVVSDVERGREWNLTKAPFGVTSTSVSLSKTWAEFCEWAHSQTASNRMFIYRGHKRNFYPLRTAFHRTGRTDLRRFLKGEFQELRHRVSALTNRRFDLADIEQALELMSIGQHHGYPTPLLDWSESPFIAAFFAFSNNTLTQGEAAAMVRVMQFNATVLRPNPPPTDLLDPRFIVGILQAQAIGNPRAVPQQSIFTFSNIVDIEGFINQLTLSYGRPLLTFIDIDIREKRAALRDLRAMGITDGSMFPGIDGTCRDLADLHFG